MVVCEAEHTATANAIPFCRYGSDDKTNSATSVQGWMQMITAWIISNHVTILSNECGGRCICDWDWDMTTLYAPTLDKYCPLITCLWAHQELKKNDISMHIVLRSRMWSYYFIAPDIKWRIICHKATDSMYTPRSLSHHRNQSFCSHYAIVADWI